MIKNFWKTVELYCGQHDEPILMEIQQGPHSLFYSCPKYAPENREKGERACVNRLNLVDYENMLNHLSEQLMKAELNGEYVNLNHHRWVDKKGTSYEVFFYSPERIKISMINKRALK